VHRKMPELKIESLPGDDTAQIKDADAREQAAD
jgi:hypothetical protein